MKVIENYIWFLVVHENLLLLKFEIPAPQFFSVVNRHTMWDLCTIDWLKEDAANFESQNFEGPWANLNIEKKISIFLVLILPKYSEPAQKCFNFWNIYYISKS